jgi:hypothetical protein
MKESLDPHQRMNEWADREMPLSRLDEAGGWCAPEGSGKDLQCSTSALTPVAWYGASTIPSRIGLQLMS